MAIATPTDRGFAQIESSSTATTTMTSSTFTPTKGTFLVACPGGFMGATPGLYTPSDTFGDTGGTSWVEVQTIVDNNYQGAGFTARTSTFVRRVGNGASSGAITITRTSGTVTVAMETQFFSITADRELNYVRGATGSAAPGVGTLTCTFPNTPYRDSIVFGHIHNGIFNTTVTQPSGYTEVREVRTGTNFCLHEYAYQNGGSPAINPAWTSTVDAQGDDVFANVIEITEAPIGDSPPPSSIFAAPHFPDEMVVASLTPGAQPLLEWYVDPTDVATVVTGDFNVVGYLPAGVIQYTDVTHDATVTGYLPAGAVPYAAVSHDTSVSAYLPAALDLRVTVSHDAAVIGYLPAGAVPYNGVITLEVPTIGYLPAGAIQYATISHAATVAAYLPAGAVQYAPISHNASVTGYLPAAAVQYATVTRDASVTGYLPGPAVLYAVITGGSDISVVGYLPAGVLMLAPVSHQANVTGYLPAAVDLRATVSHTASVAGYLPGPALLYADVSHLASVVGYLPAGAILYVGGVGAAPEMAYPTAFLVDPSARTISLLPSDLTVELAASALIFTVDASGLWLPVTDPNQTLDLD